MALMGVELMFNAANLNLVAFAQHDSTKQGWFFSLFLFVVVACESAIALAIFYLWTRQSGNPELDKYDGLFKYKNIFFNCHSGFALVFVFGSHAVVFSQKTK
jgi:NADH:ubiquinone oxidoreductase subunit K